MTMGDACLAGWAQVSRHPGEPLEAWVEALLGTGVSPSRIDSLDVVYCQSWPYDDPAGRLAAAVGASPRRTAYSGMGGTTPLGLVADAIARVRAGEADVCAIVGGEALAQVRAIKKAGERPAWSHRDPEKKPYPFEAPFHPAEIAHQLFQAYSTFALRDVARRAARGEAVDDHRRSLGELFAPMTLVAATNPHAWFPTEWSPADLSEPTPDNRMVAFPYTKRLVAVMDVDLAAAVVVASPAAADAAGVSGDRRLFLRGWGAADDPVYVAEHPDLARSPAMASAFASALDGVGTGIDGIGHADLYSCFPSSVSFALDALGVDPSHPLSPFTVTGGLPYAGGAGSCYLLSSLAAMAERLVADPGALGMVSGVGMHLTNHKVAVLSTEPPIEGPVAITPTAPAAARRPVVDEHRGGATVAAYTVHHGRDGGPTDAVLVCDLGGGGRRCYAAVRDPDLLGALEAEEWVGRPVVLADGGGGVNLAVAP